jgi:hypothetical protein
VAVQQKADIEMADPGAFVPPDHNMIGAQIKNDWLVGRSSGESANIAFSYRFLVVPDRG